MKIHKVEINNKTVTVYNDSNVDWVVQGGGHLPTNFSMINKLTMKHAAELYIRVFANDWDESNKN